MPILRVTRFIGVAVNPGAPDVKEPKRKRNAMFAAIVRFVREWKNYNRSLSELSRLGDRELADIGVSRSDIPRLAWSATHKK
jgi:uncharacterized protein YjiS (DUF1127 family)